MFYLDCKTIGPEKFEISWGWPLVLLDDRQTDESDSDVPSLETDKTVTHAVIEYIEGRETKRIIAETSPYVFTGKPSILKGMRDTLKYE